MISELRYDQRLEHAASALMRRKKVALPLDCNIKVMLQELSNEIKVLDYDPSDSMEDTFKLEYKLTALRKPTHYTVSATVRTYW